MKEASVYKGIVFDFDGTLIDSQHEGLKRFLGIAASLGLSISDDNVAQIRRLWGVPGYVLVQTCWPDMPVDVFMDQWEVLDRENPLLLFSETKNILERLCLQFSLSILTSRGRGSTHFHLQYHRIKSLFSFICTLDDSSVPKPNPCSIEPLLRQYERCGIMVNDLIFVGDSIHSDYGLARAIGIDFIAVTWGVNTHNDFLAAGLDPRYIIDTIEDLPRILTLL